MVDSTKFKLWNDMAQSFHFTSSHSSAHIEKYKKIADYIIKSKSQKVLDLGCGSGILEKELIKGGFNGIVDAYDASSSMIKIGTQIADKSNISFRLIDIDNDYLGNEKYDVIVSINLLFFLKDKKKFFKNIYLHLKDRDSVCLLVTPKPSNQTSDWEFVKEHFRNTSVYEKILIFINEIINIPRYINLSFRQKALFRMEKTGDIVIDEPFDIEKMASFEKLEIIKQEDIHAKQNWLFVMRQKQ